MSSNAPLGPPRVDSRPRHLGYVVFIAASAAMGGFLFGYDSAVINGAVEGVKGRFEVGSATLGAVIAIALVGAALGAMLAGRLADRLGRPKVMQLAALFFAASSLGCMMPFTLWDLAAWRILGGVAIGMASVIAPAYIAEVAPAEYRGRLASFQQAAIVLGIAVSQLVNYGLLNLADGDQRGTLFGVEAWQLMLGAELVPALVYGALALRIPESPRYLVAQGRFEEAKRVLARVEPPETDLDAEVRRIDERMRSEHKPSLRDLLGGRFMLLPIVWVGIGLSVFQQLVGINVIFYYSSSLWQSVGVDPESSFFYSFTTSIINIVGTVIAMLLVDRLGRKPLALIGSAGMAVSLGVAAWAFSFKQEINGEFRLPDLQGGVALVAAHSFVLFFALSWGVVVWVMLGEMFPNRIRAAALGVAAGAQWLTNWLITVSFPTLSDWNLSGSYVIYTVFAVLSIPFILKWVPETKGKALEEMG
ncbi:sugar porter family MFS transporter [Streptomyces alkaliterrae]|uniref:Sugar porter family MFS transporter n=1 Tax=Streptomyces alkaliterrae TaxID=2213162 RepID=A0A5P0YUT5_9ACTN|nr:sugar porter family MFS transporter [Streptomyces alkaliterrae]MBB1255641.1 sugar porter family MFS transporter [Streptomyces alkaliterrae]MBB1257264.1 sugar porter family MFS transporter [Streptomyces alkaliterrae]MQS03710.1 sugar porter family MFS transporter [Streptomyces alkaliterrae]